jgi:uncharacterized protein with FMN-binding domain
LAASAGIVATGWQVGAGHEVAVARAGTTGTASGPEGSAGGDTSDGGGAGGDTSDGGSSDSSGSGSYTGRTVQTRFGPVQVQVTLSGGKITDVAALQLPQNDGHSARISSAVEPMLRSEVLSAQSADIQTISGATYTSEAYVTSLQSALDSAQ